MHDGVIPAAWAHFDANSSAGKPSGFADRQTDILAASDAHRVVWMRVDPWTPHVGVKALTALRTHMKNVAANALLDAAIVA